MLYLIGLGLHDERDLPLRALDVLKICDEVYAEVYTGKWNGDFEKIEKEINRKIQVLPRERVESSFLIERAVDHSVALLVPGDPLAATTHIDLFAQAKQRGISVKIIHSSSIFTAIAECGLSLYKFGRKTTLAQPQAGYAPTSPYDVIAQNKAMGLHSLVLLDVPMTVKEGCQQLLSLEKKIQKGVIDENISIVACCAIGSPKQIIRYAPIAKLISEDPQIIPAVLIIPGNLHFKEAEVLELWE
jgi:diphthine synthase